MIIDIPCHREQVTFEIPVQYEERVKVLGTANSASSAIGVAEIKGALSSPIETAPLAELARGRMSVCIVISDITRPVPNKLLLPPILDTLETAGISREAITLLIATGMHRPNLGEELVELVGADIAENYRIINHDCRAQEDLREVMKIDGAAIEINRHYLDADLKILTGLIEPHPFAGFSGGGKSILPGISSFETMTFMHSFALVDHPDVATAKVENNPFRHHVNSICQTAGVDFIVNVIVDHSKQPIAVFAGDVQAAFAAGCEMAERNAVVRVGEPGDLIITSAGGYPLDATFYQSTKGLIAAGEIVRPGGTLLLISGCCEGLGSESYCRIINSAQGSPAQFREIYSDPDNFVIDQWGAQAYFQALERAGRILLYSPNLTQEQVAPFGITLIHELDQAIAELCAASCHIYVVPEGPYVASVL
ncbi:Nickel-dependent lactate racemase [Malonomonas rubra DSM 5091]|uniref:Nickel-dependent lactate racemase n=1 Tax=Malonomonas rubra DSM 5091 TaxID=1122189 RepID=A0A1M6JZL2_MALRU|nr:nickel-dependent lactate racemase [Malonomonas rubra]SHJ52141.1 Nickel-dependent lactate racemase [Malonomonas rubra DSM 5091]